MPTTAAPAASRWQRAAPAEAAVAVLFESYRGHGYLRGEGCLLPAHYRELQAIVDALSHAAQLEMVDAIRGGDECGRERAYGKWLAFRGLLRAVEARGDEWTPAERAMLERIDWRTEQFRFPGIEAFNGPTVEPGTPVPGPNGTLRTP